MAASQVTTETVLQHHLEAFSNNDLTELMKDYTEHSEVWTPQGAMVGLDAINSFYTYVFTLLPKQSTRLEIQQKILKEDKAYIVWNAESAIISIPIGTDSFYIKDEKILWQSLAAHIIPKS
jgi:predicted dinucleotide-utilizing enzyme